MAPGDGNIQVGLVPRMFFKRLQLFVKTTTHMTLGESGGLQLDGCLTQQLKRHTLRC